MNENGSIGLKELESHLFKCADIIRNTVSITQYKDYILPLVFYKTISDTYDDEFEELKEEYGDEEIAKDKDLHKFKIPNGYGWEEAVKRSWKSRDGIGEFLDEALAAIENENKGKLQGVFKVSYDQTESLTDSKLAELVKHLDGKNLSIKKVPPDILGEAYMDLVKHFAEKEGSQGGEYFTPPHIVELMVRLLSPFKEGNEFHDPAVGSGSMLTEAAKHYSEVQGEDTDDLYFTGQEINPQIAAIAKMNLLLHDLRGEIKREDSLAQPLFLEEDGSLKKFDYVMSNFPFSADWSKDDLEDDKYDRFHWAEKLPRKDRADYAFIMHMVAQLKDSGKLAVVIPHGVLFRKHEKKFRRPMIEKDIIEAVIGLPENLFQNNSIPSAVFVFNKEKSEERKEKIQFISASQEDFYEENTSQNKLTEEGVDHIAENYKEWKSEERVSRVVDISEIEENDYNLNIALYVDTTEPEEDIDVAEELKRYRKLKEELEEIESVFDKHMEVLGYE